MMGYVPMASLSRNPEFGDKKTGEKNTHMTGAHKLGTFRSHGFSTQGLSRPVSNIGYVEMMSGEPEYVNVPKKKYDKAEQVYGPDSMDYYIPVPRAVGEAKNVSFEHHVYVNVPPRSRLTSDGTGCSPEFVSPSSGASDMSGCSPEFDSHSPGVSDVSGCSPEFQVSRSPGVSDVSGCSPEFVSHSTGVSDASGCTPNFLSRSLGVSDSGTSPEFLSQSPGVSLRTRSSQHEESDYTREIHVRGTDSFAGKAMEDTWTDYRRVDMESVAGERCYHADLGHFDDLEVQGYRCIVSANETNASRAFGLSGTYELEVDMVTPAIILTPREAGTAPPIIWPLRYIRRYGTDGNGIFRLEAGRRCYPGPGIFTFRVLSGNSQDILGKVELASDMHLNVSD
ncbi:DOK1 [Branchiostoma lanceolatum]|uniref:DOK1 protein n=1 Tax=Branchiostoma lanceolatum TaxID=7740 RepID=A0A8K0EXT9_BRALA|nr:DOK1 [Branchiostoma lanceolatum]